MPLTIANSVACQTYFLEFQATQYNRTVLDLSVVPCFCFHSPALIRSVPQHVPHKSWKTSPTVTVVRCFYYFTLTTPDLRTLPKGPVICCAIWHYDSALPKSLGIQWIIAPGFTVAQFADCYLLYVSACPLQVSKDRSQRWRECFIKMTDNFQFSCFSNLLSRP